MLEHRAGGDLSLKMFLTLAFGVKRGKLGASGCHPTRESTGAPGLNSASGLGCEITGEAERGASLPENPGDGLLALPPTPTVCVRSGRRQNLFP